ncbi:MAG: hypothetical protein JST62_11695 [Bacteroidetes bacterium]|jgi:hypothetical protein|nr:hypothetical protein [Bacteroidota bacterium]
MEKKLISALGLLVLFLSSNSSSNFNVDLSKDVTLDDAKSYFKNYRLDRQLSTKDGSYENFTEGYIDLSKEQIDEIQRLTKLSGQNKVRVYSGYDGNNYYLLLNGVDRNGGEIKSNTLKAVFVGGTTATDCPKYCDITSTYLYSK